MEPDLTFTLFGPLAATGPDGTPVTGLPRRGVAILAVLAATGGMRLPRGALAALIWGDREDEQARASLRQELSVLRRLLPLDTLCADRREVWLNPEACRTDTSGSGTALAGLDIPSPPFEDWLREARSELDRARDDADRETAQAALEAGNAGACLDLCTGMLARDPLNEAAVRLALRAGRAGGRGAEARRLYDAFTTHLRADLETEPAPETTALAAELDTPAEVAPARPGPLQRRPCLAVLPFAERGAAPDEMLADGIVEEITGALSRVHEFHVIARQSAFALKDVVLDVQEAADRLGADYLVEGTVQRAGERVQIAVQLVNGADGHTLWSERFDDRLDDLFDLQDRIAAQVAGQLSPSLRFAEIARAEALPPGHRSAYSLMLSAMPHFWAHRREENLRAIEILQTAVDMSPDYAPARAYLAWVLAQQPSYLWSDDPVRDRALARDHAMRALERTTDHSPSLVAVSAAFSMVEEDQVLARKCVERALQVDPNSAWGWMRLGWVHTYDVHFEDAIACFNKAEALSPLDPFRFNMIMGRSSAPTRDPEQAEVAAGMIREAMAMAPGMTWANRTLATALLYAGRKDEARDALRALVAESPGLTLEKLNNSVPPSARRVRAIHYDLLTEIGLPEA